MNFNGCQSLESHDFLEEIVASGFHRTNPTIHDFLENMLCGFFFLILFYFINSLEKEIGESRLNLLKVLLFKTMSTINASPAFLDSDGLAKGFMAWQHT